MMRQINNPDRGCGKLRKGMCYARGDMGPGGTLEPASLIAGWQHSIGNPGNVYFDIPARKSVEIDIGLTLAVEEMIDWLIGEIGRAQIEARARGIRPAYDMDARMLAAIQMRPHLLELGGHLMPGFALADHIGSSPHTGGDGYTAYSFGRELKLHGPNRAIPPMVAKRLAGKGAFPIVFTHSEIPFFHDKSHAEWFINDVVLPFARDIYGETGGVWGNLGATSFDGFTEMPTWWNPDWTLKINGDTGERHWLKAALWYIDQTGDTSDMDMLEAPVWVSWITSIVYTATGPDDETAAELAEFGIEPVMFDEDE